MSNSSLVTYTRISPNKNTGRNHVIDTITIHCVVAQWTAKQGCDYFANTSAKSSCNYMVGKDGTIGLCVEEKDRSWCTSNSANDNRAVTIEVASDKTHPYAVTNEAYEALIKLVADICRRNGITRLVWSTSKSDRVNHANGCNMTVHRDYANKACPGEFLYSRHGDIANRVNALLGVIGSVQTPTTSPSVIYRIRKSWADSSSQVGAYSSLDNAKKACPQGYSVFDNNGNVVYTNGTVANSNVFSVGVNYKLLSNMIVRNAPRGFAVGYNGLTADGKRHDTDKNGTLDKGTVITCQEVRTHTDGSEWIKCPSGWICGRDGNNTYVTREF